MERPLKSALVAEVYGTFLLTFIGTMAITIATDSVTFPAGKYMGLGFIGLAFGIALIAGVASVGPISSALFNPAITIAFAYAKRFPKERVVPYIAAQAVGAVLASLAQLALVGTTVAQSTDLGITTPNMALPSPVPAALLAEVVGTMILAMTALSATTSDSMGWAPLAIGLSLSGVIWAVGDISGASLNPARSFGPALVSLLFDSTAMNYFWIYIVGPVVGALVAAEIYRATQRR